MNHNAIILAAGAGARMKSRLPKVLQPLASKPLLGHILQTLNSIDNLSNTHIVTGFGKEKVEAFCNTQPNESQVVFHHQAEQSGTGHAAQQTLDHLTPNATSIILYGDVPLIKASTIETLLNQAKASGVALLTQTLENPKGYGRIIRENNQIIAIVEEKDATDDQKAINEINTDILAITNKHLLTLLPKINNNNQQQEYYLTDIIELAQQEGLEIASFSCEELFEAQGVNDKTQLSQLERAYQKQQANQLMAQGVTLIDPSRFDIRGNLRHGTDVSIDVNCLIQGDVTLGNNVTIEANCILGSSEQTLSIGDGTTVKANSLIEAGVIDANCTIVLFARLRPETHLMDNTKIGNFVEIKKSTVGKYSKVNHLSYIGDAQIGEKANIGAGTITCNYDGVNKHTTTIKDNAFIGSNTSLVAPVTIAENSTVSAGSTLTRDIEKNKLAIARGKQRNIDNWQRPEKK